MDVVVTDQLSANGERFGKPAAIEIGRQLRAPCHRIGRIERGRPVERLGCFFQSSDTVKEISPMEMIFGDLGGKGECALDSNQCLLGPAAQHLRCR